MSLFYNLRQAALCTTLCILHGGGILGYFVFLNYLRLATCERTAFHKRHDNMHGSLYTMRPNTSVQLPRQGRLIFQIQFQTQ